VLPLDGYEQLAAYFDRFMLPRSEGGVRRVQRAATA
jgi:hypothetical protein